MSLLCGRCRDTEASVTPRPSMLLKFTRSALTEEETEFDSSGIGSSALLKGQCYVLRQ